MRRVLSADYQDWTLFLLDFFISVISLRYIIQKQIGQKRISVSIILSLSLHDDHVAKLLSICKESILTIRKKTQFYLFIVKQICLTLIVSNQITVNVISITPNSSSSTHANMWFFYSKTLNQDKSNTPTTLYLGKRRYSLCK